MPRSRLGFLFYGCALAGLGGGALAQTAPQAARPGMLEEVVVTARRASENLQTVPVAVSVVTQAAFDQQGVFRPDNLTQQVPGLVVSTSEESRDTIKYTIRGQNQVYNTLFPAVITYFNEVPITQLAAGQFFDLANVQVLRGPQGVLFGRVTDGGNVMVTPQHPTNTFGGYLQASVGDYGLKTIGGAINLPVVEDRLLLRLAGQIDRRDGFTRNLYTGRDVDDVASDAGRVSVTFKPTANFENTTVVAYQRTHNHGTAATLTAVNPLGVTNTVGGLFPLFAGAYGINSVGDVVPFQAGMTPLTTATFIANLQNLAAQQVARGPRQIFQTAPLYTRKKNLYAVNTDTLDLTPDIQIKNILGYTWVREDNATNYVGANGGYILTCHAACGPFIGAPSFNGPVFYQEQLSEELRIAGKSFDHKLSWSLGGYLDYQHPPGDRTVQNVEVSILHAVHINNTTSRSRAVFAWAEYDASDVVSGLKINGGLRYTKDSYHNKQANYDQPIFPSQAVVAALTPFLGPALAQATALTPIPSGCAPYAGGIFASTCMYFSGASHAWTWQAGASYTLPSGQMAYAKLSRGYRPGGVNSTTSTPIYQPEFDRSLELGFKGDFNVGDMRIRTDVAAYRDNYTNIQKNVVVIGANGSPAGVVANVAEAIVQGIELETTFQPVEGVTLGLNYDITDAHFKGGNPNAGTIHDPCNPKVAQVLGWCTANRFSYTPHTQLALSADYRLPVDETVGTVSVGARWYHQASMALNETSTINPEAVQKAYSLLDLNANWNHMFGRPVDLSIFVTNVTNKLYMVAADDLLQASSVGISASIWSQPRMYGLRLKYHFGEGR